MKHSNINQRAFKLAHQLKTAYSSFRAALLVAYRVLRSNSERLIIIRAMNRASGLLYKLGMIKRVNVIDSAVLTLMTVIY